MTEIVADGQPFETPLGAAAERYAATPPSLGAGFAAMTAASSSVLPLARAVERGRYAGSSPADQGLFAFFTQDELGNAVMGQPGAVETPRLSAQEAQERYAPMGPDGKRVALFDQPVPEGVARSIGKAKEDEIAREGVLSRFAASSSLPVTFGTGIAAFLADPLNLASSFIPGPGEGAIAARLGGSFAARVIARGAAGAEGGALAQAPSTALRYGLGREEGSDYSLREAFRDMLYGAAGGALLQAGFGTAGELLARRRPAPVAGEAPEASAMQDAAAEIATAPASVKGDAMRAAVSEIVEGRPVEVEPVFQEARSHSETTITINGETRTVRAEWDPAEIATRQRDLHRDGFASGVSDRELAALDAPRAQEEAQGAQPAAGGKATGEGARAPGAQAAAAAEPSETERLLAAAEAQLKGVELHPEDKAELARAEAMGAEADAHGQALAEAAQCLTGAA